jgi:hypothetical protein
VSELLAPRAVLEQMASGAARSYPIFYADDIEFLEVHHRAQGYVYLRMLGRTPPAFHER